MALDEKQKDKVRKAVTKFLDTRDSFKAKRRKAVGEINEEEKTALNAIRSQVAKLDITKEAFNLAIVFEQHVRDARGVPEKAREENDLELAGGFANVLLATGTAFEPVLGEDGKAAQEAAVVAADEAAKEPEASGEEGEGGGESEDGKVESIAKRRARKTAEEQEQAAQAGVGLH